MTNYYILQLWNRKWQPIGWGTSEENARLVAQQAATLLGQQTCVATEDRRLVVVCDPLRPSSKSSPTG